MYIIYIYIYIYIYTIHGCWRGRFTWSGAHVSWPRAATAGLGNSQEGAGSVRFVQVPDFSKIHRFGSVRL